MGENNDEWSVSNSAIYYRWSNVFTGEVPVLSGWNLCLQFYTSQLFFSTAGTWYRMNVNGWSKWKQFQLVETS